jgi:U3 small nucleolar RNA-associated protein 7
LTLSEYGPYKGMDFTRNGRNLLLAGRKGHIAMLDWKEKDLSLEF